MSAPPATSAADGAAAATKDKAALGDDVATLRKEVRKLQEQLLAAQTLMSRAMQSATVQRTAKESALAQITALQEVVNAQKSSKSIRQADAELAADVAEQKNMLVEMNKENNKLKNELSSAQGLMLRALQATAVQKALVETMKGGDNHSFEQDGSTTARGAKSRASSESHTAPTTTSSTFTTAPTPVAIVGSPPTGAAASAGAPEPGLRKFKTRIDPMINLLTKLEKMEKDLEESRAENIALKRQLNGGTTPLPVANPSSSTPVLPSGTPDSNPGSLNNSLADRALSPILPDTPRSSEPRSPVTSGAPGETTPTTTTAPPTAAPAVAATAHNLSVEHDDHTRPGTRRRTSHVSSHVPDSVEPAVAVPVPAGDGAAVSLASQGRQGSGGSLEGVPRRGTKTTNDLRAKLDLLEAEHERLAKENRQAMALVEELKGNVWSPNTSSNSLLTPGATPGPAGAASPPPGAAGSGSATPPVARAQGVAT